ncbi:mechanosensitive ion channel family protein [Pseudodesulfovibrio senegalensis]|jgi:small-conductance mechanosensitive channel|uniref:Mechanosensitive ion channel family protein n=1 Tax=Pseudodesulfovibrio senegalensis TaxID=1721087 RepID=A0A6N6N2U5_9BACT|nr:mechanosensitive ion channel family protein [Pseudodesulfovibrio senegalensis]KAB1441762.1 mechanosensitive ion channel family protein [Pseudodesulfovibrio senegalensis]
MKLLATMKTTASSILANPHTTEIAVGAVLLILGLVAVSAFCRILNNRLKRVSGIRVDPEFLDQTLTSLRWTLWTAAAFAFFRSLPLSKGVESAGGNIFLILFTFLLVSLSVDTLKLALDTNLRRKGTTLPEHRGRAILPIIKGTAWLLGLAFILDNFGVKIGTIMAGLGLAGVAVGFAAQAILGDLFSYFAILFDKPFRIGDFIIVDNLRGTLEHTGLKTSRLRSLDGEQIIISNSDLTGSRVKNYRRMRRRRICFGFGVLYSTGSDKLEAIPDMVRAIVDELPLATLDRVHFHRFGDSSLDFEVVYYVESPEYNDYMDTQQAINLALVRRFEAEGIGFAFPTRTVHMAGGNNA